MGHGPRLGAILLKAGVIDEFQLDAALQEHRRSGELIGLTLVRLGFVEEHDLLKALSTQLGLPIATLHRKRVDEEILALVPRFLAAKHGLLPLFARAQEGQSVLYVAMQDPSDAHARESVESCAGMSVKPVLVAASELATAIDRLYGPALDLVDAYGRPAESGAARAVPAAAGDQAAPAAEAEPRPVRGEADPRVILQALTKILIDKRLVGRDELMQRVCEIELDPGEPEAF